MLTYNKYTQLFKLHVSTSIQTGFICDHNLFNEYQKKLRQLETIQY